MSAHDADGVLTFQCEKRGKRYCEEHRLSPIVPIDPIKQISELDEAAEERLEELVGTVASIARAAFPGGCKLTVHTPGYTIHDRVRELKEEGTTWFV